MSKQSRRAAKASTRPARRSAPPPPRRWSARWLVSGAILLVVLVAVGVVWATGSSPAATNPPPTATSASAIATAASPASQDLPGIQRGPAPWPPELARLAARLEAIGLPALTAAGEALHTHQHLDLFIDGQPIPVPADIGINAAAGFLAPIHTHDATGIIHVESPVVRAFTLGNFFDVWGVALTPSCVGGACQSGSTALAVFVNGQHYSANPRDIVLAAHEEICVCVGTLPSTIPASYAFPAGL